MFYKTKLFVFRMLPSRIGRLIIKDMYIWRLSGLLEAERLEALGRFHNRAPGELSELERYFKKILDKRVP
jgi:hypothetical protein